ncbi:hypothetical protein NBT14_04355 [Weissella paramesenteroides]|uniref:hypothetical protein n=1 Tax=Weissella paramesenteroides TaxID=1249 RepID=UPI0024026A9F|nr:hypothetical protein [Weissella paramesenteroides]MDF8366199.1 hypothetical protein [Weissella paramesenteroides]
MGTTQQYMHDHFFNPLDVPKPMGRDLFNNDLVEGDDVYEYEKGYFLISKLTKGQKDMAKAMKLKKVVL